MFYVIASKLNTTHQLPDLFKWYISMCTYYTMVEFNQWWLVFNCWTLKIIVNQHCLSFVISLSNITSSYVVYSLVFRFETKTKSVVNHLTIQKAVLTILTFVFTFTTYTQLQDWTDTEYFEGKANVTTNFKIKCVICFSPD